MKLLTSKNFKYAIVILKILRWKSNFESNLNTKSTYKKYYFHLLSLVELRFSFVTIKHVTRFILRLSSTLYLCLWECHCDIV